MSNISDDQLLRRAAVAEDLRSLGHTITAKTLATMACRGGGPPLPAVWPHSALPAWCSTRLGCGETNAPWEVDFGA